MSASLPYLIAGGAAIGAAAGLLMLTDGEVAGISGIWSRTLNADAGRFHWRWAFLAGLLIPAICSGATHTTAMAAPLPLLALAGMLVGVGTRRGSGCTSGHGVCGNANLSLRSLVATLVFMVVAGVTVFITHHLV